MPRNEHQMVMLHFVAPNKHENMCFVKKITIYNSELTRQNKNYMLWYVKVYSTSLFHIMVQIQLTDVSG
jgi:tRNA G37 N-methylase Trm5